MGSLKFAVKTRKTRFDVDMTNSQVFDMPVETSLELMIVIGSHGMDPKGKPLNHMVNELDGSLLIVKGIDV